MQVKRLADTYLIRLEKGETVIGSLEQFADAYRIGFGVIQAIGTFQRATLGYYDPEAKSIQRKELEESVEVLSLSGNITQGEDGQHLVHAHVALGRPDYTTYGGHLVEATAGPTVEIVVETAPTTIRRRHDPDTGGQLWDLEAFEVLSV